MKKAARKNKDVPGMKPGRAKAGKDSVQRGWPVALAWAGALVGGAVILSAVVNPLFGRSVHWDWMAGLAPMLFVVLSFTLRRRWV